MFLLIAVWLIKLDNFSVDISLSVNAWFGLSAIQLDDVSGDTAVCLVSRQSFFL